MSTLAIEFGISDRGLAKVCGRHRIPVPPRGYWAKVTAGERPKVPPFLEHVDFHPEVTRVFHRELTRLKVMFCGLCWGQDMRGLPFRFGYC